MCAYERRRKEDREERKEKKEKRILNFKNIPITFPVIISQPANKKYGEHGHMLMYKHPKK